MYSGSTFLRMCRRIVRAQRHVVDAVYASSLLKGFGATFMLQEAPRYYSCSFPTYMVTGGWWGAQNQSAV
jgi:hypothetical protein